MLTELHIENLGVIEEMRLDLGDGFIAFTGETGAGKTMLIEAISLLVGGRADASVVRSGAAEARVEGRFVSTRPDGTPTETVLCRVVPLDGRSRAYVNGRMATVSSLSEIGSELVDIHGQHDHQKLLTSAAQRRALDAFGAIDTSRLRLARERVAEIDAVMATLGGDERARAREIDLLRFQTSEIENARIESPMEDEHLREEQELLSDVEAHRSALQRAVEESDAEGGILDRLGVVRHVLAGRPGMGEYVERLSSVIAELGDIASDLRGLRDAAEEDPERLSSIVERRQLLRDIMRKYGATLDEVIEFGHESSARLAQLEGYEDRVRELQAERAVAMAELRSAAEEIASARRRHAPRLAEEVEKRLRDLAMEHASLAVNVNPSGDDVDSGDNVVFLLSANPGSPLLPLGKVASGGELARTMLALRLVLTEEPGTMVFDEVDAGIGGEAALAVARALGELGSRHQIFAVTHLPQVAAAAHQQVGVRKRVEAGATYGAADLLSADDRVAEIARMLSGGVADDIARQHARELIETFSSSHRR